MKYLYFNGHLIAYKFNQSHLLVTYKVLKNIFLFNKKVIIE